MLRDAAKPKVDSLFRLFFLKEDAEDVQVGEAEKLDVEKINNHLALGGSVFISCKPKPHSNSVGNKALATELNRLSVRGFWEERENALVFQTHVAR